MTDRDRNLALGKLAGVLRGLLDRVRDCRDAWPFNTETPSGLSLPLIANRLREKTLLEKDASAVHYYRSKEMLVADLRLMAQSYRDQHAEGTDAHTAASKFEMFVYEVFEGGGDREQRVALTH